MEGTNHAGCADCFTPIIMERVAELGDITKDTEARLKESIHVQSLALSKDICDTNRNIAGYGKDNLSAIKDAACMVEKTIMENRYFLHDNILKAESSLSKTIDNETDLIKLQLGNFETRVSERLCGLETSALKNTQAILNQLSADKLDEKNDIIARLRSKNERHEDRFIIANEINGLKTMINSVEQNQRFSNKTVQFGTGNLAGTAQTANQG